MVLPLVENMVKKNRSYFPIAVLLTTMISVIKQLQICFFGFTIAILKFWGHEIHRWKGLLKAPKFSKFQLVNQKNKVDKDEVGM